MENKPSIGACVGLFLFAWSLIAAESAIFTILVIGVPDYGALLAPICAIVVAVRYRNGNSHPGGALYEAIVIGIAIGVIAVVASIWMAWNSIGDLAQYYAGQYEAAEGWNEAFWSMKNAWASSAANGSNGWWLVLFLVGLPVGYVTYVIGYAVSFVARAVMGGNVRLLS